VIESLCASNPKSLNSTLHPSPTPPQYTPDILQNRVARMRPLRSVAALTGEQPNEGASVHLRSSSFAC